MQGACGDYAGSAGLRRDFGADSQDGAGRWVSAEGGVPGRIAPNVGGEEGPLDAVGRHNSRTPRTHNVDEQARPVEEHCKRTSPYQRVQGHLRLHHVRRISVVKGGGEGGREGVGCEGLAVVVGGKVLCQDSHGLGSVGDEGGYAGGGGVNVKVAFDGKVGAVWEWVNRVY